MTGERRCVVCEGPIQAGSRADRLTCSERCKKAHWRTQRRRQAIRTTLAAHVEDVRRASNGHVPPTTATDGRVSR